MRSTYKMWRNAPESIRPYNVSRPVLWQRCDTPTTGGKPFFWVADIGQRRYWCVWHRGRKCWALKDALDTILETGANSDYIKSVLPKILVQEEQRRLIENLREIARASCTDGKLVMPIEMAKGHTAWHAADLLEHLLDLPAKRKEP